MDFPAPETQQLIGNIYACASLVVWLLPLLLRFIANRTRNAAKADRHRTIFSMTVGAFSLFLLVQVVFPGNPPVFPASILALEMLLFVWHAYQMNRLEFLAAVCASVGGVLLVAAQPIVLRVADFGGSEEMRQNAIRTRAELLSHLRAAELKEETVYPSGPLTSQHPIAAAHPEIKPSLIPLFAPKAEWHSFFTNFYRKIPLAAPVYPGGAIREALKILPEWQWNQIRRH